MAKYFRITEIDAATFERMTGDELDCLQVAMLADDGNVYVAVDEDGHDCIDVDLEMFIDKAPTIDAVPVVRCKDCAVPHNKYTGCPKLNGLIPPPDFYCAAGE